MTNGLSFEREGDASQAAKCSGGERGVVEVVEQAQLLGFFSGLAPSVFCAVAADCSRKLSVMHTIQRVGFFDLPPPRPEAREREPRPPHWMGPPEEAIGAPVPATLLVAKTDRAAVGVTDLLAFPTGFSVRVVAVARRSGDDRGYLDAFEVLPRR